MNPLRSNGKFAAYTSPLEHLKAYTRVREDTGCLEWTGAVDKDGYGKICTNKRTMRPHRLAYNITHGIELRPDQQLNHKCHNRLCWNPEHVYVGTQKQNMEDRDRHGNSLRGENHPQAILTPETVLEIRRLHAEGHGQTKLARMVGVKPATIYCIISGKTWRHLLE